MALLFDGLRSSLREIEVSVGSMSARRCTNHLRRQSRSLMAPRSSACFGTTRCRRGDGEKNAMDSLSAYSWTCLIFHFSNAQKPGPKCLRQRELNS